ncbi:MAG: hypothetical protein IT319_00565 [Anaerolineae bacterium]|nr:hypothetical protein [Anaerolineae bacterium]
MSIIEDSLAPGESVLITARHHELVILLTVLRAMMIGLVAEIAFFVAVIIVQFISLGVGRLLVSIPTDVGVVWLYLAGNLPFIICGLILGTLNYYGSQVVLTNQRIFVKTGVLRRRLIELSLNPPRRFRIFTPPLGRVLGFKVLLFARANDKIQRATFVDKANTFEEWIAKRPTVRYDGQPAEAQTDAHVLPPPFIADETEFPEEYTARMLREASLHIEHHNPTAARKIVERLLQSNSDNANVWYMAGYLSASPEKKRRAYERALAINPRHRRARQKLDALP